MCQPCGSRTPATKAISQSLSGRAILAHEPIRELYKPRLTLGSFKPAKNPNLREANTHFRQVVATVMNGTEYVETGWPSFTWFEQFHKELGERWRYIHLVRNPVHVAASFVTHGYYQAERADNFPEFAILQPTDAGVSHPEIAAEWRKLTVFDKCLYQWLEINAWAAVLTARNIRPAAVVRFEEFIEGQLYSHTAFLGEAGVVADFIVEEHGSINPFTVDTSCLMPHRLAAAAASTRVQQISGS